MKIVINEDVVRKFNETNLSPDIYLNTYLVLLSLKTNDTAILNMLDDGNTSKRMIILYHDILRAGLIRESEAENNFELTELGNIFIEELLFLTKEAKDEAAQDYDAFFEEWINLFPKGIKSGGKLVKSDKRTTSLKMKKFLKDYDFEPSLILRATRAYLSNREKDGWKFVKCATYFIDKKGEGSTLAEWCEQIKEKADKEVISSHIKTGLV